MRKGFTLIENIMVILLIGILFAGVAVYIQESIDSWVFMSEQKELLLDARSAMARMTRELKTTNRNVNLTVHTSTEVTFRNIQNNSITFRQDGSALKRNTEILAENLLIPRGLNFRYFDDAGSETSGSNMIESIRIRLTIVSGQNKFVIESSVGLRIKQL
ncbi:MAG: type II secretion system protein [Candidatus Margulisiibacteriota bacterium]|jgi:prepilin-type N-terminal cleavage/methylation domain-containing protein